MIILLFTSAEVLNPWIARHKAIFCIWLAYLIDGPPEIGPKFNSPFQLVEVGVLISWHFSAMRDSQQVILNKRP